LRKPPDFLADCAKCWSAISMEETRRDSRQTITNLDHQRLITQSQVQVSATQKRLGTCLAFFPVRYSYTVPYIPQCASRSTYLHGPWKQRGSSLSSLEKINHNRNIMFNLKVEDRSRLMPPTRRRTNNIQWARSLTYTYNNDPPKRVNGAKEETKRSCPVSRIIQWFTSASKRWKFPVAVYNSGQ